jgi:hypothetical protein
VLGDAPGPLLGTDDTARGLVAYSLGDLLRDELGTTNGAALRPVDGTVLGIDEGGTLGVLLGTALGAKDGKVDGDALRPMLGCVDSKALSGKLCGKLIDWLGILVGAKLGLADGNKLGAAEERLLPVGRLLGKNSVPKKAR